MRIPAALRVLVVTVVVAALAVPALAFLSAPSADPAVVGAWGSPFEAEVAAVNMALLPDGRVLYYSGVEADASDSESEFTFFTSSPVVSLARVWDPATGAVAAAIPADGGAGDLFCSGTTVMEDGRVLAAGGSEWFTLPDTGTPVKGVKDTRLFNATDDTWTDGPSMSVRRWYPSVLTLSNGDALVASGIKNLSDPSTHNSLVEVLESGAWRVLGAPPMGAGDVEFAPMNLPMYPRLHLVSGGPLKGKVFYNTVGTMWGPFGERPEEGIWSLQQALDLGAETWSTIGPSVFGARQHAAVVPLLLDGSNSYAPRFLTFGGTLQRSVVATPLAEIADLSQNPPANSPTGSLAYPRWHVNGVLGPDGGVYAIGGALYDNVVVHGQPDPGLRAVERYDPATGAWQTLASQALDRGYHSTAILLPDARILSGGHVPLPNPSKTMRETVNGQIVETRMEVFEPPYLFLQPASSRPAFALSASDREASWTENRTFSVSNLEGGLHSVVLMRPGATTHSFDADQRGIKLAATATAGGVVTATLPPDSTVAPPGWYMLFVNENVGGKPFPSKAEWIHLS